jgi:5-methylcytosine-specific restriction endonuclease McrA
MSRTYLEKKKKKFVREHANFCCEYCQSSEDFSTQTFVMEHIIPIYANGDNSTDNLALSCQGCNGFKYVKTNVLMK